MRRSPSVRRVRCMAAALGATLLLAACGPPPPLAARPKGDAFGTERLYHDGAPWTAAGVDAALQITSSEPRFGGWSGLALHGDSLMAVSDRGYWLRVRVTVDDNADLTLSEPRFGTLIGPDGAPLRRGQMRDAEDIVALPDGGHIVAFEREHRLWLYPAPAAPSDPPLSVAPVLLPPPPGLEDVGYNTGIEAMAALPDGRLIAFVEGDTGRGRTPGWLGVPSVSEPQSIDWHPLHLMLNDGYRPTGAAVAANGDLLVLERYFSIPFGFSSRVRRIKATDIAAGATLDGPVVLSLSQPPINDNFEGIAAEALPDGTTRVLLMTDDNYSGLQRTLLLAVRLANPSS